MRNCSLENVPTTSYLLVTGKKKFNLRGISVLELQSPVGNNNNNNNNLLQILY